MNLLESIKTEIQNVPETFFAGLNFDVMFNADKQFGDIATNILMRNKDLDSKMFLERLGGAAFFKNNFSKIEIAKNNYINFFLSNEKILVEMERVEQIAEKKIVLETKYTSKNILVEHSSPNLFKPFHVGHLMNNIIGEAIVRLMKSSNANVSTMSFPSDISLGIAKAVYIIKKDNIDFENDDAVKILGEAYVIGTKFYDENPEKQEEIKQVAKNLFHKNLESEDWNIYEKAKTVNVKYFLNMLESLDSHFDSLIYESEAGVRGESLVKENINLESEKEVFEIGEGGAIVFDTKRKKNKESDETIKSVFINGEAHPTYEAKDLGLIDLKFERYNPDLSIFVTDNEQVPHFEVVLQAGSLLNDEWKDKCEKSHHVPHGRMTLKGEKMSSRIGNVLTAEDIFNLTEEKAKEKMLSSETGLERLKDFSDDEKNGLIKNISLSALRIAILRSRPGVNIDFDPETSLNFEGATGPYLLYTYARANSILEKANGLRSPDKGTDFRDIFEGRKNISENQGFVLNENQNPLAKKIIEFESVVKRGIEDLAPQLVVKYLFELTQAFNSFYANVKIIDENDLVKTGQNIYLTKVFARTLKFALNMIGIKEVEKM